MIDKIRKRDGRIVPFEKEKIAGAIFKSAQDIGGQDKELAEKLAEQVSQLLDETFDSQIPTVEDIQDAVEKVLIKNGHAKTAKNFILYRQQKSNLRETKEFIVDSIKLVEDYIGKEDWRVYENANATYSLPGLLWYGSGTIMSFYGLHNLYPKEVANAHIEGYIHIHNLSMALNGYSFYRNEVITIRKKHTNNIFCLSFEQLFDMIRGPVDNKEGFEIKYNEDYEVLDEKGWTPIIRVLRHKTEKELISINGLNGHNLIVTEDHPLITLKQEKNIICPKCNSINVIKNRTNKNGKDYFKCKNCSNNFHKVIETIDPRERMVISAGDLTLKNYIITPNSKYGIDKLPINFNEEDGWFIGLFLAEGWLDKYKISFQLNWKSEEYRRLINYLKHKNIKFYERKKDASSTIAINSIKFSKYFSEELGIRKYSENKNLPSNFLNFPDKIIGAIVSGIIDGDGVVRNDDKWVSRVNLRMTSKTLLAQIQQWLKFMNINSSLCSIDGYGIRQYNGLVIIPLKQLYSLTFFIPREKKELFSLCKKLTSDFKFSKILKQKEFSGVRKIEVIKNDSEYVYDITTKTNTFLCNGVLSHNCAGWSLPNLLHEGFNNVPGKLECSPPKHLRSAIGQIINFVGTLQNEWAGAQAFNSFDTYLAPFVRADNLSYQQVKQCIQEFIYNMNVASRWAGQSPFTNITLDLTVPEDLKNKPVTVGGKFLETTYSDYQTEMNMINKAFIEVLTEGDARGRVFTFPIPTYNLTKDFDWDSEIADKLFEMTAKYGLPYFQNFINSDLNPGDIRAMCCRLRLNLKELQKNITSGRFGSGDSTGSVGVVTINLPRIAYESESEEEFFEKLDRYMYLAKESLEIKRKIVERNIQRNMLPYTKRYLGDLKHHFSTIGLIGAHEACLNLLGENKGIETPEGHILSIKILEFMRSRLLEFQEQTGNIYNLESTPGEGASYRLAKKDRQKHLKIITSGNREPYYTNSTNLPVGHTNNIFDALKHQEPLQKLYTGGTVFHTFLGESINKEQCKLLVKKIATLSTIPYFTITPTFSICEEHGYLKDNQPICPQCSKPTEVYSRVVGYLRPVRDWNKGKQEEFSERKNYVAEIK